MAITLNGSTGITDADGGTVLNTNDFSSQAQAQAGTDNTTVMTPLRTSEAITTLTTPAIVGTATAGLAAGAIGTYMYGTPNNATAYAIGATIAGSALFPSCATGNTSTSTIVGNNGSVQSGTWMCMGNRAGSNPTQLGTLWLRIS
jgi:hypothetical protein